MNNKLRECFDEMVVYKDRDKMSLVLKDLKIPSFLRDWVLKKFEDEDGNFDVEELVDFIKHYIPRQEDWLEIKNRITKEFERVKILTRIEIDIDIKTGDVSFALPEFGLSNKETMIEDSVWQLVKDDLVKGNEIWGVVELGYRLPDDSAKPRIPGKIKLTNFTSFTPYTVDLDFYRDGRKEFTVQEWIDVLLGAADYNPSGYDDEHQKLCMLKRFLPFVEKNLNLIELAPPGTGKSYVFSNISKYGLLVDGGTVTRAKMFYDTARRSTGFIVGHDFVAIDEVKKVTFGNVSEMQSIFQGYMESGKCDVNGFHVTSDAGIVFLGNISTDKMDEYQNMFTELPSLFKESALIDRMHGFIRGWEIPNLKGELMSSGWALNTEYFSSILHLLRDDISYRSVVNDLVKVSDGAYGRHVEAVKRMTTAYLKLLYPHVRSADDIEDIHEFERYCLRPAVKMRAVIQKQLEILDPGNYRKPERQMPIFSVKD